MNSLTHLPVPRQITAVSPAGDFLKLLPTGDGWALVGPDGKVVFDALGTGGRRRCLEFARARGVLAVLS